MVPTYILVAGSRCTVGDQLHAIGLARLVPSCNAFECFSGLFQGIQHSLKL